MLYRSPLTRWLLIATAVFAGLMLAGGPHRWRDTTSLNWLARFPAPLQWWGLALVAYGLLLAFARTRPAGYTAGFVLWAVFTISLVATVPEAGPKSAVAIAAFIDVTTFHLFAIRTAWDQKLEDKP